MEKLERSIDVRVASGKFRAVLNQAYKLRQCNRSIVQYGFTVMKDIIGLKVVISVVNQAFPSMNTVYSRRIYCLT